MTLKKQTYVSSLVVTIYFGDKYNGSPHCLMQLSMADWKRLKHHCIHLSGMIVTNNTGKREVYYNNIHYGKNIVITKRKITSNDVPIELKDVNLSTEKKNFFITTIEN